MKKHMFMRRIFAGLLSVLLLLPLMPVLHALAEEDIQNQCVCEAVEDDHIETCPLYEVAEEPTEEPVEEPAEEPVEEPAEEPVEEPIEEPTEEPAEEPADVPSQDLSLLPPITSSTEQTGASAPTLSSEFSNGTKITNLVSSGEAIAQGWEYDETGQYLYVHVKNLDANEKYTVDVILDEAVYAAQKPAATSRYEVSFRQGKKLPANGKENAYLKDLSGTFTFSISSALEVDIPIQLYYDIALWNQHENARLCWQEGPLIKVVLKNSAGNELSAVYLNNATSGRIYEVNQEPSQNHIYADPKYCNYPTVNQHNLYNLSTGTQNGSNITVGSATTQVKVRLRSATGPKYFENLKITVTLPTRKINGKTYTMEVYKLEFPTGATHSGIPYTVTEGNGTYTLYFENLYTSSIRDICYLYYKFPEELQSETLTSGATYQFNGKAVYSTTSPAYLGNNPWAGDSKYDGKIFVSWGDNATVVLDTNASAKLVIYSAATANTSNYRRPEAVSFLATYGIWNESTTIPSDPLTIWQAFDIDNDNKIGVTTVNLMSDSKGTPITAKYTLVDGNGNLYVDGNGKSEFTITLSNERTQHDFCTTLYRDRLPAEQRPYYFKTVEYRLESVAPNEQFAHMRRPYGHAYGGAWGYILDETVMSGVIARSQFRVYDAVSGQEITSLARVFSTTLTDERMTSGKLEKFATNAGNASRTQLAPAEVTGGESFMLNGMWRTDLNQYGNLQYLDQATVAVLLPAGMMIDENNFEITRHSWGYEEVRVGATLLDPIPQSNGTENLWIIKVDPQELAGYTTENLGHLPSGQGFGFHIKVLTSALVKEQQLKWNQRIFVAGDLYTFTEDHSGYARDIYDLNGNGLTTDFVAGYGSEETTSTNIKAVDIFIDLDGALSVDDDVKVEGYVMVMEATQTIRNTYTFTNNKGGQVTALSYFVKIPQQLESMDGQGKIILAGAPTQSDTQLEFVYCIEDISQDDAASYTGWKTAEELGNDLSGVTIVKIRLKDGAVLENGSVTTVSLPLKFEGNYAICAGAEFSMYTSGNYSYYRKPFTNALAKSTEAIKGILTYTAPVNDSKAIRLTAAKGMSPSASEGVRTVTLQLATDFIKSQNYTIPYSSLTLHNMVLATDDEITSKAATMSSSAANKTFGIHVKLNNGTAIDLAEIGAGDSETLGTYQGAPSFTFTLYNADALTENTLNRWVSFHIVGDNGVTIPIQIHIDRILATIQNATSTIEAGENYILMGSTANTVQIAADSAFTAQFITGVTENYNKWELTFGKALPAETTVLLLDWTNSTAPEYAYYRAVGGETKIPFTSFTRMGTTRKLTESKTGDTKLLFVVDLPDSNTTAYESGIRLVYSGQNVESYQSPELTCKASTNRAFSVKFDQSAVTLGDGFSATYTVGAANPDSRFENRNLALVLKSATDLPEDAYIVADGKNFYRNTDESFIIPLGAANQSTTGKVDLKLICQTMVNNSLGCTLRGELWVSADGAAQPFAGEKMGSDITITLNAVKHASVKVMSFSDRALAPGDFAQPLAVSVALANIPTGATMTMELQEQAGLGYTTSTTAVSSVNGNGSYSGGVYRIGYTGGKTSGSESIRLTLNRSGMPIGNYQLLFKIIDSGGKLLLSVPYRFIVIE